MTQPIQMFENLTSETTPAGGNAYVKTTFQTGSALTDRRLIELRAGLGKARGQLRGRQMDKEFAPLNVLPKHERDGFNRTRDFRGD